LLFDIEGQQLVYAGDFGYNSVQQFDLYPNPTFGIKRFVVSLARFC
jgi:hypothetical protein